jgi:mRNA interferase YafQ
MRSVIKSRAYRKDFQREGAGKYREVLADDLPNVIATLAADMPLPLKYRDHMLTGNWAGHGECHLKPDLLLVYMKIDGVIFEDMVGELRLVRLGSHSEIFG